MSVRFTKAAIPGVILDTGETHVCQRSVIKSINMRRRDIELPIRTRLAFFFFIQPYRFLITGVDAASADN